MPIASAKLTAGSYTMTWDTIDAGLIERPQRFRQRREAEPIPSDLYGTIDFVYNDAWEYWTAEFLEWRDNTVQMLTAWDNASGDATAAARAANWGVQGVLGQLASDLAKQIVLTAVTGTPAATNGPATITIPKAILLPGQDIESLFGTTHRVIPITFIALKTVISSKVRFHTFT